MQTAFYTLSIHSQRTTGSLLSHFHFISEEAGVSDSVAHFVVEPMFVITVLHYLHILLRKDLLARQPKLSDHTPENIYSILMYTNMANSWYTMLKIYLLDSENTEKFKKIFVWVERWLLIRSSLPLPSPQPRVSPGALTGPL